MDLPPNPVFNYGHGNVGRDKLTNVGNRTVYITNQQNIRFSADEYLLPALRKLVVPEAMHDSKDVVDQGTCHPGTRIAVLEDVSAWIERLDPESALKWMRGAAGAGKSAIARTLANQLASQGLLLGSFFCLRSNDRRSNASLVLPTLVEQIITRIPSLVPVVEAAFRVDPRILTKSVEIQARRLIVEPLASIEPELRQTLPRVIVIDGLDEIKGAQGQRDILKAIAFLIDNLPFPIHFFVASRPEHQIQDYFAQFMDERWSVILLDNSYHPDRDITIFYKARFSSIVTAFPAFTFESDWPGEDARRVLVVKGSGQFIFADTVIRFVGNTSISLSPQRRLNMILENVSNDKLKPLELLDLVYVTVFEAVSEEEREGVLQLVGLVLLPVDFTKTSRVIDAVLCLEHGTTMNRLRYLYSVLKAPTSRDEPIAPLHATLGDFVFDRTRSDPFGLHIDPEQLHQDVVFGILKGSMVHPASKRLSDCRRDWFGGLYRDPISMTFINNPTFRTSFASYIREAQRINIAQWPPLALLTTYRVALEALTPHSSWLKIKDYFSWRSMEKKRQNEVLRRFRSYATMGLTGHMLVFLQLLSRVTVESARKMAMRAVLEALPDQKLLARQKLTGLALPFAELYLDHPDITNGLSLFAKPFLEPNFLETFFIHFSWNGISGFEPSHLFAEICSALSHYKDRDAYFLRLLSLRNLPLDNPRWSDKAKSMFDEFLDEVLRQAARGKAGANTGPNFEDAKMDLLRRVAALEGGR